LAVCAVGSCFKHLSSLNVSFYSQAAYKQLHLSVTIKQSPPRVKSARRRVKLPTLPPWRGCNRQIGKTASRLEQSTYSSPGPSVVIQMVRPCVGFEVTSLRGHEQWTRFFQNRESDGYSSVAGFCEPSSGHLPKERAYNMVMQGIIFLIDTTLLVVKKKDMHRDTATFRGACATLAKAQSQRSQRHFEQIGVRHKTVSRRALALDLLAIKAHYYIHNKCTQQ
jgi:hypothetical protein